MLLRTSLGLSLAVILAGTCAAQQRGGQPATPPLVSCGVHGDIEVFCGTRQPEDIELSPDGKYLILTQFLGAGRGATAGGGMALFDLSKHTFSKMAESSAPDKSWGDPACPG